MGREGVVSDGSVNSNPSLNDGERRRGINGPLRNWRLERQLDKLETLRGALVDDKSRLPAVSAELPRLLNHCKSLVGDSHDWSRLFFIVNRFASYDASSELVNTVLRFVVENIDIVENGIAGYDYRELERRNYATKTFQSLELLLSRGDASQRELALKLLKKYSSVVDLALRRDDDRLTTTTLVSCVIQETKNAPVIESQNTNDYLIDLVSSTPRWKAADILRGVESSDLALVRRVTEGAVTKIIGDGKIAKDMVRSWQILAMDKKSWRTEPYVVAGNLDQIRELEDWQKGSVKFLYQNSGITWFFRYPIRALKTQIENYYDNKTPFGVIVSPYFEHNSFLWNEKSKRTFESNYLQLTELGYNVRIVEARSRMTFTRRFARLKQIYKGGEKCQFLIVNAHGSPNGLHLGDDGIDKRIELTDLDTRGTELLAGMYRDNMPIAINSCESFALAKELAARLHITVHGSPIIGKLIELGISRSSDGHLSFSPVYSSDSDKKRHMAMSFKSEPYRQ